MAEPEWAPVSLIHERPSSRGLEVTAREITTRARSSRIAAGAASVLDFGGPGGSAMPGVLASNSPIATFLYTLSRADRLSLYRYFCEHDAMVGRAIELHTELPMSRVTIGPPKGPSPRQNKQITRIYEAMSERIDLLGLTLEIAREYWMCFHPDTLVRLDNTVAQRIKDIKVGDLVLTEKGRTREVVKVHEHQFNGELIYIYREGQVGPLRVTEDHVIYTLSGDKKALSIEVGDSLYFTTEDGEKIISKVTSIEKKYYSGPVYDLSVNEDNTYVVENVCVHNCGDVYLWCNWSPELLEWEDAYCLPVEMCFLPHQHVRMSDCTTKLISKVEVGDEVISAAGIRRKVVKLYQREVSEEVVVIRSLGLLNTIKVTSNHKIHTSRGEVPAGELKLDDKILFQPPMEQIPQDDITDDHCLVTGWWLAEGSGNERGGNTTDRINMVFDPRKDIDQVAIPQIMESLEKAFPPEQWREKARIHWTERSPRFNKPKRKIPLPDNYEGECPRCSAPNEWLGSGGFTAKGERKIRCCHCGLYNRINIKMLLPSVGLRSDGKCDQILYTNQKAYDFLHRECGYGARYKKLSERWLYLPFEQQRILLQCWLFGDGEVKENGSVIGVSTSKALRDQMHLMAARLGIKCRTYTIYEAFHVDEEMIRDRLVESLPPSSYFYALYIPVDEANVKLWQDEKAIKRYHKFIKHRELSPVLSRDGQYWTEEEDQILRERYESDGREILSKELGRTPSSIGGEAYRLGLQTRGIMKAPVVSETTSSGAILIDIDTIHREFYSGPVHNIEVEIDHTYQVECASVSNCHSIMHPFNRKKEIIFFAKPLVDTTAIRRITDRDLYMIADQDIDKLYEALGDTVPEELKEALNYGEAVPLNTNWRRGSYCIHLARNRAPNSEYGESVIGRCLDTLLRLENLKNANFEISSRNMSPKYFISAPGVGKPQLDDLRAQVDLSWLEKADFAVVTNYEVNVAVHGAADRLLNTESEYTLLRQDLALGLGSTVEMLTGAASYGGQKIQLEQLNTCYLTFRDKMRKLVEEGLFRPVADAKGHYQTEKLDIWPRVDPEDIEVGDILVEEEDGQLRRKRTQVNVLWNHSTLRFNRISIRDNSEVYDQLFQLHQKGSLAVRYLLDLHNIDPEENSQALLEDIGTPRDPVFNDFIRALYTSTDVPQTIIATTDFTDRIRKGLKLVSKQAASPQQAGGAGAGLSDGGMLGGGGGLGGGGLGGAMPGVDGGMGGMGDMMGAGGLPGAGDLGAGGPGAQPDLGGAPPGGPGAQPVAASRGMRRSALNTELITDDEEYPDLPGRLLGPELSKVTAKALKAAAKQRYNEEGRSLYPSEVKKVIRATEKELKLREREKKKSVKETSRVASKKDRNGNTY